MDERSGCLRAQSNQRKQSNRGARIRITHEAEMDRADLVRRIDELQTW